MNTRKPYNIVLTSLHCSASTWTVHFQIQSIEAIHAIALLHTHAETFWHMDGFDELLNFGERVCAREREDAGYLSSIYASQTRGRFSGLLK